MLSSLLVALVSAGIAPSSNWVEQNIVATFHDYETALERDPRALDNNAPFCGHRYSILNTARIVAVNLMAADMCNQCIEIQGLGPDAGSSLFVLAVDKKGAGGLDIAGSSFQALFPTANILDPQRANWRVVDPALCGKICFGTTEECTVGFQNNLPGYLLPPMPLAPHGLANETDLENAKKLALLGSFSKFQGSSAIRESLNLSLMLILLAFLN